MFRCKHDGLPQHARMVSRANACRWPAGGCLQSPGGRKANLATISIKSAFRAVELTHISGSGSRLLPKSVNHIPEGEESGTVTADVKSDTRRGHTAIHRMAELL